MEIDVNGLMKKGINLNLGKHDVIELMVGELLEGTEAALVAVVEEQIAASINLVKACQAYYKGIIASVGAQSEVLDLVASLNLFYKGEKSCRLVLTRHKGGAYMAGLDLGVAILPKADLEALDATVAGYSEPTLLFQNYNQICTNPNYVESSPPQFVPLTLGYARLQPMEHTLEHLPASRDYLSLDVAPITPAEIALKPKIEEFYAEEKVRINRFQALMKQYHDLNKANGGRARLAIIRALACATEEGKQLIKVLEARTAQTGIKKLASAAAVSKKAASKKTVPNKTKSK